MSLRYFWVLVFVLLFAGCLGFDGESERGIDVLMGVSPKTSTAVAYVRTEKAEDVAWILERSGIESDFLLLGYVIEGLGFIYPFENASPVVVVDGLGLSLVPKVYERLDQLDKGGLRGEVASQRRIGDLVIQNMDNRSFMHYGGLLFMGDDGGVVAVAETIAGGETSESKFYDVASYLPSGDAEAVFDWNVTFGVSASIDGNTSHAQAFIKPEWPYGKERIKSLVRNMDVDGVNVTSVSEVKDLVSVEMDVDLPAFVSYMEGRENRTGSLFE